MSKLTTKRLWTVGFGKNKNIRVSNIEAASAEEAKAVASKDMNEPLTMLDSEPIYEAGIGVELDDGDSESGNGIFDITIKGTDSKKVEELRKILAFVINGMPCEVEYPDEEEKPQSAWANRLCNFINENGMMVITF